MAGGAFTVRTQRTETMACIWERPSSWAGLVSCMIGRVQLERPGPLVALPLLGCVTSDARPL